MKKSVKNIVLVAAAVIPAVIKPLNQQNQTELRALLAEIGNEDTVKELAALDAEKLSVAKTKQRLVNMAATLLPEDQKFGNPEAASNVADEKKNAKLEANTKTLTEAGFKQLEDGSFFKDGDADKLGISVTKEQAEKSTAKQLAAILTPKAPKEEFKGYDDAYKASMDAIVNHHVNFRPSSRYGDAVKTNDNGTVDGIIKSWKLESRSQRIYVEIKVPGLDKTAWSRETATDFKVGAKATDAELIAAKLMKAPKVEAPATPEAPAEPTTETTK